MLERIILYRSIFNLGYHVSNISKKWIWHLADSYSSCNFPKINTMISKLVKFDDNYCSIVLDHPCLWLWFVKNFFDRPLLAYERLSSINMKLWWWKISIVDNVFGNFPVDQEKNRNLIFRLQIHVLTVQLLVRMSINTACLCQSWFLYTNTRY